MYCPNCGAENPAETMFCGMCGSSLATRCAHCEALNPPQFKFCGECGTALRTGALSPPTKSRQRKRAAPARKAPRPAFSPTVPPSRPIAPEGERRHLTVMFCDLVGSTALSEQLDPEELREVVQAYHATCAEAITRYAGYTAQHLGDGLLVYFGYPVAHEDEAARAVRTALGILVELQLLNTQLRPALRAHLPHPIQVRIGIHTGLVVIGEIGSSEKREMLALGETPNLAARLQGVAEPDTVVLSAATHHLVQGLFEYEDFGAQRLKGLSTPVSVYRVVRESAAQSRFDVAVRRGLTPLVGRSHEIRGLRERWEQAKKGDGQIVLLRGEPGIGKSRLVQMLKEEVSAERATHLVLRCSPYHQHSALSPILVHLQRVLQFAPHDPPHAKLATLTQRLAAYRFPQAETLPLLAALLSLPHPEGSAPLTLSPQRQKRKTYEALVAWLVEEADTAPVYCIWEDLHWADPSTLEVLTLFLDRVPTTRLLVILTCRPEFTPPWQPPLPLTHVTLPRLGRPQVETMVGQVTGGKPLPVEVVQQIVAKTDGVPLFVEELTKMVLESGLVREEAGRYSGTLGQAPIPALAIPSTLHDSLMARLDRLAPVREIAQVGAVLGREFSYELLHAVFPIAEKSLQHGLQQLVVAELLYQYGHPPQARYVFKHALIQDTAYQSLLKSSRRQYHTKTAHVLEECFAELKETQPEVVAHHYMEAGLTAQAIPYWQQAGQNSVRRAAHVEAIAHLTRGLELLKFLPDTPERTQQEIRLQVTLGVSLQATTSFASPEVKSTYTRARELCRQVGETRQLFPVLFGLRTFYHVAGDYLAARELGEQLLGLAQREQDPALLVEAYRALGSTLFHMGEFDVAHAHLEQGMTLYDAHRHRFHVFLSNTEPGVFGLFYTALVLWPLGYPDQALQKSEAAQTLAQELSHPFSLAAVRVLAAMTHQLRRDRALTQERAEAAMILAREHGFPQWLALGIVLQGWALAEQGQSEEGIAQIRQGLAAGQAIGVSIFQSYFLTLLAEAYGNAGQAEEGLATLAEALTVVDQSGERFYETELYRIKGELLLAQDNEKQRANGKKQK